MKMGRGGNVAGQVVTGVSFPYKMFLNIKWFKVHCRPRAFWRSNSCQSYGLGASSPHPHLMPTSVLNGELNVFRLFLLGLWGKNEKVNFVRSRVASDHEAMLISVSRPWARGWMEGRDASSSSALRFTSQSSTTLLSLLLLIFPTLSGERLSRACPT
jgi:hypothetical protein